MVGVPGKFKGCETCRARRVKCDNERPACRKCVDSGRECAGYTRKMVFITGGLEDRGRVASHPKREAGPSKKKTRTEDEEEERLELMPIEPHTAAWDELLSLSNQGTPYVIQIVAIHTALQKVLRAAEDDGSTRFTLSFSHLLPPEMQRTNIEAEFKISTECIVHLSPTQKEEGNLIDSYCVFLYEQSAFTMSNDLVPHWKLGQEEMSVVRRLGPEPLRFFPGHHFFARIYRPSAISIALLHRKDTFLSSPEWSTVPWEFHPKSHLDRLFDITVMLPSIFARADRVFSNPPTVTRRLKAIDLLSNCLNVERQLDEWLAIASAPTEDFPEPYIVEEPDSLDASQIPFSNNLVFRDSLSATQFLFYWASLILFHRCIENLYHAIFHPVIDAFPDLYPNLPSNLVDIDPTKYQQVRGLASNICRSLDSALSMTTQPDLLLTPLTVVSDFYKEINTSSSDGELEILWCENFRLRLISRGQNIADVIQSKTWMDVGRF